MPHVARSCSSSGSWERCRQESSHTGRRVPYGERDRTIRAFDGSWIPSTGRLTQLIYDADGDGRFDTWAYMDGDRLLRMETDADGDGLIDRWEYYDAAGTLMRVERRTLHNGLP